MLKRLTTWPNILLIACIALLGATYFLRPSTMALSQAVTTVFKVGTGSVDLQPRQIIRTNDDRVYIFASHGQDNRAIYVYYTTSPGLPTSAASFNGFVSITDPGFPISVDPVYDGGSNILLFVNNNSGQLRVYPFDLNTNTFRNPSLIASGNPTVPSGMYVGTNGISALASSNGNIHLSYWAAGNQIAYRRLSYSAATNTLTTLESFRVDNDGQSNHPMLAVSPVDSSVTVTWMSETGNPATVLARTRSSGGTWGNIEQVSNVPVWRSNLFGINVDQGPNIVIDSAGTRHVAYIENYDSTGDYGRVNYAFKRTSDTSWTSAPMAATSAISGLTVNGYFYSHTPTLALDGANNLYVFGHGPTLTRRNTEMYYAKRNTNGSWGPLELLLAPPPGDSLDASPSVKWSAVGFNRPDAIEMLFFLAPGANYVDVDLYYARLGGGAGGPTPTPGTPTPVTPTVTLTASATPGSGTAQTIVVPISASSDDANEVNGSLNTSDNTLWVGGAGSSESYLGLRFTGVNIPRNSTIQSAVLEMFAATSVWISMDVNIGAEAVDNSTTTFSPTNRPSQRTLTTTRVVHTSDQGWSAGAWYPFDDMRPLVQQIVNRGGWNSGNSLTLVLRGTGGLWARKFMDSFEGNPGFAPRLRINFTTPGGTGPTATSTSTLTATSAPPPNTLDTFNRANGTVGTNWSGETGGFSVDNNQLLASTAGAFTIYWNGQSFDADQDAFVTLTTRPSSGLFCLILKASVPGGLVNAGVSPCYNFATNSLGIYTKTAATAWTLQGTEVNISPALDSGNTLRARLDASGRLEVFRDQTSVLVQTLSGWTGTGFIGVAQNGATGMRLDNFGGSTLGGPLPSNTPTNTATITPGASPTPLPGISQTILISVNSGSDDANEVSSSVTTDDTSVWVGGGGSPESYLGLRFNNVSIPRNATIQAASLEMYANTTGWVSMDVNIGAEAVDNSTTSFSASSLPSLRTLTTNRVIHASNVNWTSGNWYTFEDVTSLVQTIISRGGWNSGNSLTLVLKGTGGIWGRKFASSFENNPALAPRLRITFSGGGGVGATATRTPSVTPTLTPTASPSPTAVSSGSTTVQVNNGNDDANEVNGTLALTETTLWVGNGGSAESYLGIRFNGVNVPRNANIQSAFLDFYSPAGTWMTINVNIGAEATDNSSNFALGTRPSLRSLTSARVTHSSNVNWPTGTWNTLEDVRTVVQEVVNRPGWVQGNSLSIIIKGNGGSWSRKFMSSYEGNPAFAPRLRLTFSGGGGGLPPTNTAVPTNTPAAAASDTPVPTMTFTPGGGTTTVTIPVRTGNDDVNEDGTTVFYNNSQFWLGTAQNTTQSYVGLRFTGVTIPRGATIISARLEIYSTTELQWKTIAFQAGGDAVNSSVAFTDTSRPSQRVLTVARVNHNTNIRWNANSWIVVDEMATIVQEIVNRGGWVSGNNLSLILRGTGTQWARKFALAFESGAAFAPRLVITYSG